MPSDSNCSAPEVHLLGEIVIAWGNLEYSLEAVIWQLLKAEDRERFLMVQAITTKMSFQNKVHAFASMFLEKRIASAEPELKRLTKDLFEVERKRNELMHSAWHLWRGRDFARMKASTNVKRGLKRRVHRMPPAKLESARQDIDAAFQSLAGFAIKYIQAPRAEK